MQSAAAWVMVKGCPAMVSVETRWVALGLACVVKLTVPLPVPDAPEGMETQASGAVTAQAHAAPFVRMLKDPAPPVAATLAEGAESENVHPAAACVMVKVCPAKLSVDRRGAALGLACVVKLIVPLPAPEVPEVTETQASGPVAVQEHPPGAVTVTEPGPPAAATLTPGAESV